MTAEHAPLDQTLQVHPGPGVVARFRDTVVFALPPSPAQETRLDELLRLVEERVLRDRAAPGRRVARALAGLLAQADPEDLPGFAVVGPAEKGLALLVSGSVDVLVQRPGAPERLSGDDVSSWVDRVLPGDTCRVDLLAADAAVPGHLRGDLRSGVVAASGASLLMGGAAGEVPAVDDAAPGSAPLGDDVVVGLLQASHATTGLPPLPEEPSTAPGDVREVEPEPTPGHDVEPVPEPGVEVEGVLCSRQHFNDPASLFCSSCGISMVHLTHHVVRGPRPPLGVLVVDDGATVVLDRDHVVGREPEASPDVASGWCAPLPLSDPERTLSRVHARVELHGWDVRVVDLGSANGTYLTGPDGGERRRLQPHEPVTVAAGTELTLGGHRLVVESHSRSIYEPVGP